MKFKNEDEIALIVKEARKAGKTIVWENGCYDLLHAGHVVNFRKAKALGDILIVGVNSDLSIKMLKGENRPICFEAERLVVLEAIQYIDYIVMFDDLRPHRLLKIVTPDIFVKGDDYNIDTIDQEERKIVEANGGRINFIPHVVNLSTSLIIERIKS